MVFRAPAALRFRWIFLFYNIKKGGAAAERIQEIIDTENPLKDKSDAITKESFNNDIVFKNISFKDWIQTFVNKILSSLGIGKSTLAYHIINCILSLDEEHSYNEKNFTIYPENKSFKLISNKSNPNFISIDIEEDKKSIDINQIRNLILSLNKSSFNTKPRLVLIDNIELLNINSVNALLKIVEEPNENIYFILINSNKKILSTLLSRCINFKIFLDHKTSISVINKILNDDILKYINKDLINYYATPGQLYYLTQFFQLHFLQ